MAGLLQAVGVRPEVLQVVGQRFVFSIFGWLLVRSPGGADYLVTASRLGFVECLIRPIQPDLPGFTLADFRHTRAGCDLYPFYERAGTDAGQQFPRDFVSILLAGFR